MSVSIEELRASEGPSLKALLLQEYQSLREEMIKRIELRQNIINLTIISAGVVLGLKITEQTLGRILLVYPLLVLFLAATWVHHGMFLMKLGSYLKEIVEPILGETRDVSREAEKDGTNYTEVRRIGYENDIARFFHYRQQLLGWLSSFGLFLSVQVLSLWLGWAEADNSAVNIILRIVSLLSITLTILILSLRQLPYPGPSSLPPTPPAAPGDHLPAAGSARAR